MKEMTCIVCPNGCRLSISEENGKISVSGNKCSRGEKFAIQEITMPMRTICSTVATVFEDVPVVPVRVSEEIPKEKIFDCMREIDGIILTERLASGEKVIENILGLGADVIVTSDVLRGEF